MDGVVERFKEENKNIDGLLNSFSFKTTPISDVNIAKFVQSSLDKEDESVRIQSLLAMAPKKWDGFTRIPPDVAAWGNKIREAMFASNKDLKDYFSKDYIINILRSSLSDKDFERYGRGLAVAIMGTDDEELSNNFKQYRERPISGIEVKRDKNKYFSELFPDVLFNTRWDNEDDVPDYIKTKSLHMTSDSRPDFNELFATRSKVIREINFIINTGGADVADKLISLFEKYFKSSINEETLRKVLSSPDLSIPKDVVERIMGHQDIVRLSNENKETYKKSIKEFFENVKAGKISIDDINQGKFSNPNLDRVWTNIVSSHELSDMRNKTVVAKYLNKVFKTKYIIIINICEKIQI